MDVDASGVLFSDLEVFAVDVEQVSDFLHVYLVDGDLVRAEYLDEPLDGDEGVFDAVEQQRDDARDEAFHLVVADVRALHRVGLAGRGLAVDEQRRVEAFEHAVDQRLADLVEDLQLRAVLVEDSVEAEGQVAFRRVDVSAGLRLPHFDHALPFELQAAGFPHFELARVHRPHPAVDLSQAVPTLMLPLLLPASGRVAVVACLFISAQQNKAINSD